MKDIDKKKEEEANRFYIIYFASLLLVIYIIFGYIGIDRIVDIIYEEPEEEEYRDFCKTLTVDDYWIDCEYSNYTFSDDVMHTLYCNSYGIMDCGISYLTGNIRDEMFHKGYEFKDRLYFNSTEHKLEEMVYYIRNSLPEPLRNITIAVEGWKVYDYYTFTDDFYLYGT